MRRLTIAIGIVTAIIIAVLAALILGTYATVSAENYNNLGVQEYEKGNYEKAIEYFTKAIELKPDYAEAYFNRGLAHFKTGSYYNKEPYEKAIQDFTKAIELKPDFADAYYHRSLAYIQFVHYYRKPFSQDIIDKFNKAVNDFNKVLELDPNYALAYAGLGNAYYRYGEWVKADKFYDKALENKDWILAKAGKEGLAGVYYSKGRNLYQFQKYFSDAVSNYEKAIELYPDLRIAVGHLVGAYMKMGEHEKVIETATRAIELSEKEKKYGHMYSYYYRRGESYCMLGEYEKAMADYEQALKLKKSYRIYISMAKCYAKMGDEDKARECYEKAIELLSESIEKEKQARKLVRYYVQRGECYLNLGIYEKALEDFQHALKVFPPGEYYKTYGKTDYYVEALKFIGITYAKMGDIARAKETLNEALKLAEEYELVLTADEIKAELEALAG